MITTRTLPALAAYLALTAFAPAQAHLLGASGAGLTEGIAHPFSGLDHLLAMIAVGFWAAQLGGRAVVALPIVFPLMMAAGAVSGGNGLPMPGVEAGVAASVVVLGALVAFGVHLPLLAGAGLVGLFALLHGHSYGTEMPMAASPAGYALGFLGATLVLHLTGIAAGQMVRRQAESSFARVAGSGTAAAGLVLLARMV